MKNNQGQVRGNLVRLGILNAKVSRQEILHSGFIFGLWTRQGMQQVEELNFLTLTLNKIDFKLEDLQNLNTDKERFELVTNSLLKERGDLKYWFALGLWTYIYTWLLGHDYYENTTESVRKILLENTDIRKASSNWCASLQDLKWSNDSIETFHNEKLVPFLYEPSLRKWSGNVNMAVMTDLEYAARQLDDTDKQDNSESRIKVATKELVSGIPFVGKALAVLIYGTKK
jgi:hypothetical protein